MPSFCLEFHVLYMREILHKIPLVKRVGNFLSSWRQWPQTERQFLPTADFLSQAWQL